MKRRNFLVALCTLAGLSGWPMPGQAANTEISPSLSYAQAVQIEKEIALMKRHYKIAAQNPVMPIDAELKPRHAWQNGYMILIKLNMFRRKHGLSGLSPVELEPALELQPLATWSQTQRILTEIRIVKMHLGIPGGISPATPVQGKRLIDVFNKLNQISHDMDALNGEAISPSYVYAEALRLNEDINDVMRQTATTDTSVPPARTPEVTPADSLQAAFGLMEEIQRIQRKLGIEITDFSPFNKQDKIVPADVFNMIGMCLAEIQPIKVQLSMKHKLTPAAEFHKGKIPADVVQLLGYNTNKLHLVNPR